MEDTPPTAMSSSGSGSAEAILIPSLPNDVSVNILARVPRCYHPTLCLVSKPFRALLSSPLYYTTRSLLRSAEPFLHLSIRTPAATAAVQRWFALHHTKTAPVLVPLPPTPSCLVGSSFAALGPKIYVIGGSIKDVPSPHVWALDCRFGTWEKAPSMSASREFSAAGVVDGRIYVVGGCVADTWTRSRNWAEVYDPDSRAWKAVDSAGSGELMLREKWMHGSAVMGGRLYAMADRNGVVYEPGTGRWGCVETELDLGWRGRACVVGGVLYCYDYLGKIRGFDEVGLAWRELKGVEKELPSFLSGATMATVGGKLVVVWEGKGKGKEKGKEMELWCAEIEVEKKGEGELELWGKVEWCRVIHTLPGGSSVVHCLEVTL
ncbi:hypothetical protein Tsubulata_032323 [Turnera subulata]|uniref:F-box domain-containing protein n=1 Tax=Turnera subulata TaxID=218843 RepID=A0A9Q0G1X9_9ROSI|nr:hypothetical protein Tsubulata_032323 [Turnera subulata]